MLRTQMISGCLFLTLAFCIVETAAQTVEWPERRCATLTWPDGRETKIQTYKQNEEFVEACAKAPGKCKLDGKPFSPGNDAAGRAEHRRFADATVHCILGPLPVEKK